MLIIYMNIKSPGNFSRSFIDPAWISTCVTSNTCKCSRLQSLGVYLLLRSIFVAQKVVYPPKLKPGKNYAKRNKTKVAMKLGNPHDLREKWKP